MKKTFEFEGEPNQLEIAIDHMRWMAGGTGDYKFSEVPSAAELIDALDDMIDEVLKFGGGHNKLVKKAEAMIAKFDSSNA